MNNGNRRRSRRRYKVRYDRIIAVALVFMVLILAITSCAKGCSDDDKKENSQNSVVDQLASGDPNSSPQNPGASGADNSAQLNAGALEFTTQSVEYTEVFNGDLVLVNSLYQYKFQEGDINPVTLYDHRENCYSVSDYVITLDTDTITQLNSLMRGFTDANANEDISVIGGYRTLEEQNDKYQSGTSKFQGGYSDYNAGRSFDIGIFPKAGGSSNYYAPEGIYAWIDQNAADYGFILRFPEGKNTLTGENARTYTYRYVGVPHAAYIKQNNLCLEEYIEQIKAYTSTSPLSVMSGANQYAVYYVQANVNSATEVPVPSNRTYTISGNNVDGFIVTVTMS